MYKEIDEIRNMEIQKIELEQDRTIITDTLKTIKKRHAQDVLTESEKTPFHEPQDKISRDKIAKERFASDKQVIELKMKLEDSLLQTKLLKIDIEYAYHKLRYHYNEKSKNPSAVIKSLSEISQSINQIAVNTQQN